MPAKKPERAAGRQVLRVIVDDFRRQASSYRKADYVFFVGAGLPAKKPECDARRQVLRVIVDDFRWQASSYRKADYVFFVGAGLRASTKAREVL